MSKSNNTIILNNIYLIIYIINLIYSFHYINVKKLLTQISSKRYNNKVIVYKY